MTSADFPEHHVEKNYEDFSELCSKECFDGLVVSTTDREDAGTGEYVHDLFVIPELSFHLLKLKKGQFKKLRKTSNEIKEKSNRK